jgi:hypothetical protein
MRKSKGKREFKSQEKIKEELKEQMQTAKTEFLKKMSCTHENLQYVPDVYLLAYCTDCSRYFYVREFNYADD